MKIINKDNFIKTISKYKLDGNFKKLLMDEGYENDFIEKVMKVYIEQGIIGVQSNVLESLCN